MEKMVKTGIKIFARLRPTKKTTSVYEVGENEDGQLLSFTLPRSESGGAVNNKREIYSFKFCQVFDCSVGQDVVFNAVSRDVIDNCLEGYNGTIFAYGQVSHHPHTSSSTTSNLLLHLHLHFPSNITDRICLQVLYSLLTYHIWRSIMKVDMTFLTPDMRLVVLKTYRR